jgi:hypothetical protein
MDLHGVFAMVEYRRDAIFPLFYDWENIWDDSVKASAAKLLVPPPAAAHAMLGGDPECCIIM